MNKKGQNVIMDFLLIPIMLIFIIFIMFFSHYAWTQIRDGTDLFTGTKDQNETLAAINTTTDMFQYIFVMVIAAIIVALGVTGYFLDSNVAYGIIGVIMILIVIIIAVPFRNAYEDFRTIDESTEDSFAVANAFMDNLPMIVLFAGAIFIILLYGKNQGQGGGPPI